MDVRRSVNFCVFLALQLSYIVKQHYHVVTFFLELHLLVHEMSAEQLFQYCGTIFQFVWLGQIDNRASGILFDFILFVKFQIKGGIYSVYFVLFQIRQLESQYGDNLPWRILILKKTSLLIPQCAGQVEGRGEFH